MKNLIIIGAGGFGLEVAAYAHDIGLYDIKGFLDDTKPAGTLHGGLPVLGPTDNAIDAEALYVIAVGAPNNRAKLAGEFTSRGAKFATLLHPASYVADTSTIDEGTILAPFSFAGPECKIGKHCLLNIYASVAHESQIGDYCALAPYAGTHASSVLGETVFMGAHATVTNGIRIGSGATIAAGSVVYNDLPDCAHAMGNPARFK